MSVIANLTGNAADAANYSSIAHNYITQWQTLGIAMDANPPHTTLAYGMSDTHGELPLNLSPGRPLTENLGLLYNLYSDKELGLGLVPQSVYDMQSNFYPTVMEDFGVPLDTRHDYTKSKPQPCSHMTILSDAITSVDWEMFAAAITSSSTTSMFISRIAAFINQTPTNRALTDLYSASSGESVIHP